MKIKTETKTLWVSPSRLESWNLCPYKAENHPFVETEATEKGKLFHKGGSLILAGKLGPELEEIRKDQKVGPLLEKWESDPYIQAILDDPFAILYIDGEPHEKARPLYDNLFIHLPLNQKETHGIRFAMDLLWVRPDGIKVVTDWKTGRSEPGSEQIRAYCWAVLELYPEDQEVIGHYYMVETGQIIEYKFNREDLKGFPRATVALQNKYQKAEKESLPRSLNKYCSFCDFRETCSETQKVSVDLPWKLASIPKTEEEFTSLADLLKKMEEGKKLLDNLIGMAKENRSRAIKAAGGVFLAGGYEYKIREVPSTSYSFPVEEVLKLATEEEIPLDFLSVSLSGFQAAAKGHEREKELIETVKKMRISNGTREIIEENYIGLPEVEAEAEEVAPTLEAPALSKEDLKKILPVPLPVLKSPEDIKRVQDANKNRDDFTSFLMTPEGNKGAIFEKNLETFFKLYGRKGGMKMIKDLLNLSRGKGTFDQDERAKLFPYLEEMIRNHREGFKGPEEEIDESIPF